jgi:hypothetical protein
MSTEALDVVISFDTTGSMAGVLGQVRKRSKELVERLFKEIPELHVGVMAHGDYSDAKTKYLLRKVDLTDDKQAVLKFIKSVPATFGGDSPEAYEYALHEARSLAWRDGVGRVLVVIGDEVPHGKNYKGNKDHLDWRVELQALADAGVKIYGVQAHGTDAKAKKFYQTLAEKSGGTYLTLGDFKTAADLLAGIAMRERGEEDLSRYAREVTAARRMDVGLRGAYEAMLGRALTAEEGGEVEAGTEATATEGDEATAPPKRRRAARKATKKPAAKKPARKPARKKTARKPLVKRPTAEQKKKARARVAAAKKRASTRHKGYTRSLSLYSVAERARAAALKRARALAETIKKLRAKVKAARDAERAANRALSDAKKKAARLK